MKSLSPQTLHIRNRISQMSKSGRKQWDLFRYLLDPYILLDATRIVCRNRGAGGLDGKQVADIKGKEWAMAVELSKKLRTGTYRPSAVRRVYIPKSDGSKRPLGVPNIDDRIIQAALVLLMEPIYEQRFHNFSYGFRPGRKAVDCAALLAKHVYKYRFVLEADIQSFFDQVRHNKLLHVLKREVVDPRIIKLISFILKSGSQEVGKPWQASTEGTPQGGPLSPLLANIYLHYFLDERFQATYGQSPYLKIIRYADDFVIVGKSELDIKIARRLLVTWMNEAGLSLKASKTRVVNMSNERRCHQSKFEFLGFKFHLRSYKDNAKRFWIARQPSEKSRKVLRQRIRTALYPGLSLLQAGERITAIWRGWANYFRYSNANRIFYRELNKVRNYVTWFMGRKYRRQRRPVAWGKLYALARPLYRAIRPIQVIPDHLAASSQQGLRHGRA